MTGSEPAHGNLTPPRISPSCPHCVILQPDGFQMLWTIELIVALPFEGHDSKWDAMSKQRLQIIIHNATKCIVIGQSGTTSDYKKRNYYMVDHADFLLAVYDNNRKLRSGTGQTVNYALKQNLRIIFLHPDTAEIS